MLSSYSINRLFVFVDYANKLSPTCTSKSFLFASTHSDCPDFLFEISVDRRPKDYLNANFDLISHIPKCVLGTQKYVTFTVSIGA